MRSLLPQVQPKRSNQVEKMSERSKILSFLRLIFELDFEFASAKTYSTIGCQMAPPRNDQVLVKGKLYNSFDYSLISLKEPFVITI